MIDGARAPVVEMVDSRGLAELVQEVRLSGVLEVESFGLLSARQRVHLLQRLGFDPRALALAVYDELVTEESSDAVLEWLRSLIRLPAWMRWLPVWRTLDALVPERLRSLLVSVLYRRSEA